MINISFFAKRAFLSSNPSEDFEFNGEKPTTGYLKRVSSTIRADQISKKLGAKLNPKQGFEKDVCIFVKPDIVDKQFNFLGIRSYIDIIDELHYVNILRLNPKVGAIVLSERDYVSLSSEKLINKIVLIPQHHANFEKRLRTRKKVEVVGIIANKKAFPYLPKELKPSLKERGMKLIEFSEFYRREDIIEFYKQIDIQIVWRPWRKRLANPLKIVNAASFGIPTIALEEPYFKELGNAYIAVKDFSEFLHQLDRLRTEPSLYNCYQTLCLKKADYYHINNIVKLYKKL